MWLAKSPKSIKASNRNMNKKNELPQISLCAFSSILQVKNIQRCTSKVSIKSVLKSLFIKVPGKMKRQVKEIIE